MSEIRVIRFKCVEDLSKYTNSLLFDSTSKGGDRIASGIFVRDGKKITINLDILGDVAVTYKGEVYHTASEFPDELLEIIRKNPNDWEVYAPSGEGNDDEDGEMYATLNNWFSFVCDETGDDEPYEDDLSKATPDDILTQMKEMAEILFNEAKKDATLEVKLAEFNVDALYIIKSLLDKGYTMEDVYEETFCGKPEAVTVRMVSRDKKDTQLIGGTLRTVTYPEKGEKNE